MAYGDDRRSRDTIAREGVNAGGVINDLRSQMIVPTTQQAYNQWLNASDTANRDYGNIMGEYDNFSRTGGYSALDKSHIRNRALSPIRSMYSGANREVDRQRTMQGGYMPGYGVLKARMARDMNQGMSDATGGTEAAIAQMVNEGKRFGAAGKSNLYGQTPGLASMFGNQLMQSTGNWLQNAGLQNQLSLGIMGAQNEAGRLPGNFEQILNRAGQIGAIGSNLMNTFRPTRVPGGPQGANLPGGVANPSNNLPPSGASRPPSPTGATPPFNPNIGRVKPPQPEVYSPSSYGINTSESYGNPMGSTPDYINYAGGGFNAIPNYGGSYNTLPGYTGSNNIGNVNNYDWSW